MLGDAHRNQLLSLARTSIECAFEGCFDAPDEATFDEPLRRPAGAFVTLRTHGGDLRGCIGSIYPRDALVRSPPSFARCAVMSSIIAAFSRSSILRASRIGCSW